MNRRGFLETLATLAAVSLAAPFRPAGAQPAPAAGPLRRHPDNGRYFSDGAGNVLYLTGSHTWSNLQDQLSPAPPRKFAFDGYLDWMQTHGHNFMRGWMWEQAAWDNHTKEKLLVGPLPYARTGPGNALDGESKFNLHQFNPEYFDRLRSRVIQAGQKGIYVSVMLFQGFSVDSRTPYGGNPWLGHPYHGDNNINRINGDPRGTGSGRAIHTLAMPAITALQEMYVRKVVDTLNDLDNVLYEIGNEHYADSAPWQYHMIRWVRSCEAGKPKQHPVGMTSGGGGPDAVENAALFRSPADWISPRHEDDQPYRDNPPAADGAKVVILDTDHLWGLGGSSDWVWKSFTRGLNPILMDPYEPLYGLDALPDWGPLNRRDNPLWEPMRRSLGHALRLARRMNLVAMEPANHLASSAFCLAHAPAEYLVYLADRSSVRVDLAGAAGPIIVEWFDDRTAKTIPAGEVLGGEPRHFASPLRQVAVLHLKRK